VAPAEIFSRVAGRQGFFHWEDAMLCLSRKIGELIDIGDSITVMVIEIKGSSVRLGVQAPQDVPVNRREITETIRRQIESGRPLHEIEAELDLAENHCRTPAARGRG
jgi:carbon storage regulator